MGSNQSSITIFSNDNGRLVKDYKTDKLLWINYRDETYECDLKSSPLTLEEYEDWFDNLPDDPLHMNKIVDNCIIYCNCRVCGNTELNDNGIPERYIKSRCRSMLYNKFSVCEYDGLFHPIGEKIYGVGMEDIRKYTVSFGNIHFNIILMILREDLE